MCGRLILNCTGQPTLRIYEPRPPAHVSANLLLCAARCLPDPATMGGRKPLVFLHHCRRRIQTRASATRPALSHVYNRRESSRSMYPSMGRRLCRPKDLAWPVCGVCSLWFHLKRACRQPLDYHRKMRPNLQVPPDFISSYMKTSKHVHLSPLPSPAFSTHTGLHL